MKEQVVVIYPPHVGGNTSRGLDPKGIDDLNKLLAEGWSVKLMCGQSTSITQSGKWTDTIRQHGAIIFVLEKLNP